MADQRPTTRESFEALIRRLLVKHRGNLQKVRDELKALPGSDAGAVDALAALLRESPIV